MIEVWDRQTDRMKERNKERKGVKLKGEELLTPDSTLNCQIFFLLRICSSCVKGGNQEAIFPSKIETEAF